MQKHKAQQSSSSIDRVESFSVLTAMENNSVLPTSLTAATALPTSIPVPNAGDDAPVPPPSTVAPMQVDKITLLKSQAPQKTLEESSAAGFNYWIDSLVKQFRLSFVIVAAVFGSWASQLFFNQLASLSFCILLCMYLSWMWHRELKRHKDSVTCEAERKAGLSYLEGSSEPAEVFNVVFSRFWIIYEPTLSDIIVSSVNPILEYYTPSFLESISLSEFTLGSVAPRVTAFRANPRTDDDIVRFDMDVVFQPKDPESLSLRKGERNSKIVLSTRVGRGVVAVNVPVLVEKLSFEVTISIQLKLMNGYPFVKLLCVTFPEKPKIDFVLKPLNGLDIMDMPGLNSFLNNLITNIVGWLFVSPNVYWLDLDTMMNGGASNIETAVGVLMIKICEAKDLKNVEAMRQSDPYTAIKIGGKQVAKTRFIENNLNPFWNETFYILINSLNDTLEFHVFDKDLLKDRPLGNVKAQLTDFDLENNNKHEEIWRPLRISRDDEKLKTKGELKVELSYFPVPISSSEINKPISGLLRITIHQAKELDETKSLVGLHNPFVEVYENDVLVHRTKVKKRTNNPQWESTFQILVRDINNDKLKFVVRDQRDLVADPEIGDFEIPARDIVQMLSPSGGQKIEWWSIRNADSGKVRLTFNFTPMQFDHVLPPLTASSRVVLPPAIGIVRIKVIEAKGLKNFETVSVSDPYVHINYLGACRAKTSIVNQCLDPLWNDVFYMLVQDTSLRGVVNFNLFDFNQMQKDTFMGQCTYDLKLLADKLGIFETWLTVMFQEKPSGNLKLELSFYPIKDVPKFTLPSPEIPSKLDSSMNSKSTVGRSTISKSLDNQLKSPSGEKTPQLISSPSVQQIQKKLSELYNTGVLRIDIIEAELDETALSKDNYSSKKKPSPYIEIYDISASVTSNETFALQTNSKEGLKLSVPAINPRTRTTSKDINKTLLTQLSNLSQMAMGENGDEAIGGLSLLYRTASQKKVYLPKFLESAEFFVKDIENARILLIIKDHHDLKLADSKTSEDVKIEKAEKSPIIGKVDLSVKDLIDSISQEGICMNPPANWYKFFSMNPQITTSVGKFKLALSFTSVDMDFNVLALDQETEDTDAGKLLVELVDARNLPAVDSGGTSDPYCNFKLNNEKVFKSKIQKKNNKHPIWNEKFEVPIFKRSKVRLSIECSDYNQFQDNVLLGKMVLEGSQFPIDTQVDQLYFLKAENGSIVHGDDGEKSLLNFKYKFVPDDSIVPGTKKRRPRSSAKLSVMKPQSAASVGGSFAAMGNVSVNAKKLLSKIRKEGSTASSQVSKIPEVDGIKSFKGALIFTINQANNLVSGDNLPDAYVKVRFIDSITKKEVLLQKTKVVKKSANPVWNEQVPVPFEIESDLAQELKFSFIIKYHTLLGNGHDLGEYHIDVKSLLAKNAKLISATEPFSIDVHTKPGELKNGNENATIHITLDFLPGVIPESTDKMKRKSTVNSINSV